jgi:penicillin-binding protein 1A
MIEDKPVKYSTGKTFGNWDGQYKRPMTIRTALQLSRNTPAVQTLQQVGLDKAKNFAVNLGIPLKEIYESYAIGGFTHGVSTLQMAGAYSAFGNNGFYTKPHAITKIKLRDGTEINTAPQPKVVMKDYTAFMITDMLKSVLKYPGTGVRANVPGLPLAGKSGTTNYTDDELNQWNIGTSKAVPDAWFTGYTTNYTTSVWTGYKDRSTPIEPGDNQKIAQDIFRNLMEYVSRDVNTPDLTVPKSVQRVRIEKGSMPPKLAGEYTPGSEVLYEYAVKGHAPRNVSDKFNKLDPPTGATASYDQAKSEIALSWNYNNTTIKDVRFNVSVSVDNGADQTLTSTSEKALRIAHPTPGGKYVFKIIATVKGNSSDAAIVSITIPATTQENPQDGQNGNQNGGDKGNNGTIPPGTTPGNGSNGGNNNNNGGNTGDGSGSSSGGSNNGAGSTGTDSTGTGG